MLPRRDSKALPYGASPVVFVLLINGLSIGRALTQSFMVCQKKALAIASVFFSSIRLPASDIATQWYSACAE